MNLKERIPETPTWRMIVLILGVFFLAACLMVAVVNNFGNQIRDIRDSMDGQRERGYVNRSVSCMGLVIDNDRKFDIPLECSDEHVVPYYPPQVCSYIIDNKDKCGRKDPRNPG